MNMKYPYQNLLLFIKGNLKKTIAIFGLILSLTSCKDFVTIDPPKDSLVPSTVFSSNELATSALLGIYQQMSISNFASGGVASISTILGVTSDEFIGYSTSPPLKPAYDLQYNSSTAITNGTWNTVYKRVYDANTILEGLRSQSLTPSTVSQIKGEALFIRAFCYFYLVNLYGEVPLYTTSDYNQNKNSVRSKVSDIYNQIILDLKDAEILLSETYVTGERVRPNKSAVRALLARIYLYTKDWANAEKYASYIIDSSNNYKLSPLNEVFLKNSSETIWQLMPAASTNTPAGALLILTSTPTLISLQSSLVEEAFEVDDQRKVSWINNIIVNGKKYYFPVKYKVKSSTTVTEYISVLRLDEQYLIRAEARAQQNNINGGISDLDSIRRRAGLKLLSVTNPQISKEELLKQVMRERRVELFSEWGHRWLDLKRNGLLNETLAPIKTNWTSHFELFPIPNSEISFNLNISQNPGY